MRWAQGGAFVAVLAWTSGAWAGGGSSGSGSGSDSGGSDSGTDTGASSGTDTGSDSGSSSGSGSDGDTGCPTDGTCTDPGDSVTLDAPIDGETLTSPVSVMVSSMFTCTCTASCCFEEEPSAVFVIVDGTDQIECDVGMCTLSLDLEPGDHVLRAIADFSSDVESTQEITITVEGPAGTSTGAADDTNGLPATTTGVGTGTGTGTDTDGAASGGDGGCSCRSGGTSNLPMALAWSVGLWGTLRRRRTRRDANRP